MSELIGIQELNRRIERMIAAGGGSGLPEKALLEIGNIIKSEMQENFRVGGRPTLWPRSIRVERFGGETLRLSGRLMNSLSVAVADGAVNIGSNLIYARIHALGGIIRAKNAEYLMFRVPAGLITISKAGKTLKSPKKQYAFVRVKQVTIPQRDYRYISPQGASFAVSVAVKHLTVN